MARALSSPCELSAVTRNRYSPAAIASSMTCTTSAAAAAAASAAAGAGAAAAAAAALAFGGGASTTTPSWPSTPRHRAADSSHFWSDTSYEATGYPPSHSGARHPRRSPPPPPPPRASYSQRRAAGVAGFPIVAAPHGSDTGEKPPRLYATIAPGRMPYPFRKPPMRA